MRRVLLVFSDWEGKRRLVTDCPDLEFEFGTVWVDPDGSVGYDEDGAAFVGWERSEVAPEEVARIVSEVQRLDAESANRESE